MNNILENNQLFNEYTKYNNQFFCYDIPTKTNLEITKTMFLLEKERRYRPTVLFTNIMDYPKKVVLMNPFKKKIMYKTFNVSENNKLSQLYNRYKNVDPKINIIEENNMERLNSIEDIPILKHQISDGGSYITAGITASKCCKTNVINLGIYRIQVVGPQKALIFMNHNSDGYKNYEKYIAKNESMPVSIFIGANMIYYICAAAKLSSTQDNYKFASKLLNKPIDLYDFDVPVPVESQYIIRGFVKREQETEGKFGEFKGYYCEQGLAPVLEVKEILCCKNPFYVSIVAGKESGLTLMSIQGEILLYFHLRENDFDVRSVKYRIEEAGEFVAVIEMQNPSEDVVNKVFEFDKRIKFVICGVKIEDPWKELSIFPFKTVQSDYYHRGKISGNRVGFIFEPREEMQPIEIF